MSGFDLLHPAVRHHVVNSLEWRSLRPLQEMAVEPLVAGESAVLLAPTAGGKTEAAVFPLLSRMLAEDWRGLTIVYVCPIRALLNNLHVRLERLCGLVGRRCGIWHGDVGAGIRTRILADPPDVLLTTPESLEVILLTRREEGKRLFGGVKTIVVDEVHAFAGDDRGWHLLALLERLDRLVERPLQRIGLSATVGNPAALLEWLTAGRDVPRTVLNPGAPATEDADVTLDYVGSLDNAATVISRLHRGEKRLVFVDSRARAEQLAAALRERAVVTYVSHSSLAAGERRRAEEAFATGGDCAIVATSTLELGIDVGDLDRVIQIDSPGTVASFLQRLGRTGRRAGTSRNCLFLATSDEALVQAAALLRLWKTGYVEPLTPPALPYHILAQQIMALALQERGLSRIELFEWLSGFLRASAIARADAEAVVEHMLAADLLVENDAVIWLGPEGERAFGRRNFLEVFSSFTTPRLFTVLHGREEIGEIDPLSFVVPRGTQPTLLLAGRSWAVTHIDWARGMALVVPSTDRGRSRWSGEGAPLSFALCQSVRAVLAERTPQPLWSRRATAEMERIFEDFWWVDDRTTTLLAREDGTSEWWTFAGLRGNAAVVPLLSDATHGGATAHNTYVSLNGALDRDRVVAVITALASAEPSIGVGVADEARANLKFSNCIPPLLSRTMFQRRLSDPEAIGHIASAAVSSTRMRRTP